LLSRARLMTFHGFRRSNVTNVTRARLGTRCRQRSRGRRAVSIVSRTCEANMSGIFARCN
jgi:hypothetical protein